ncbi:cation-transporting P-type ATPase, partial [Sphingomonas sp. FUKUSWIS1]
MPGTATPSVDADRSGLSSAVAAERLLRDGPNELPRADRHSVLRLALDVLRE